MNACTHHKDHNTQHIECWWRFLRTSFKKLKHYMQEDHDKRVRASQWLHSDPFYIFNPGYLVGSFSFLVLWLFFAFVCIRSVYYVQYCLCLWIVHSWLPLFSSVYLLGSLFIIISMLEHLENVLATYVCLFQDKTWSSNVIPRHTYAMGWVFFVFNYLKWEVVVLFDDIGGIVDHHCLNYLSHKFLGRYVNECLVCDGCQAPCTQINLQQLLFSNCKKKYSTLSNVLSPLFHVEIKIICSYVHHLMFTYIIYCLSLFSFMVFSSNSGFLHQ